MYLSDRKQLIDQTDLISHSIGRLSICR